MPATQEQANQVMVMINKTLLATKTAFQAGRITGVQQTAVVSAFNSAFGAAVPDIDTAIINVVGEVQQSQNAVTLKTDFMSWINQAFTTLLDDNANQRTVRDWIVPSLALNSKITP